MFFNKKDPMSQKESMLQAEMNKDLDRVVAFYLTRALAEHSKSGKKLSLESLMDELLDSVSESAKRTLSVFTDMLEGRISNVEAAAKMANIDPKRAEKLAKDIGFPNEKIDRTKTDDKKEAPVTSNPTPPKDIIDQIKDNPAI